jgi:hypothetical protein
MLMIYKSAGKLDEYFWGANPYEVIEAYVTGIKQKDETISSAASLQKLKWKGVLNQIESINIRRLSLLPPEDLKNEISLDVPMAGKPLREPFIWYVFHNISLGKSIQ